MKVYLERNQKIFIILICLTIIIITAYFIYLGIKVNTTSNKMAGNVKKELKDTNVDILLDEDYVKIAKLYRYEKNSEVFVRDITKIEILNLEQIVSRGNKILATTSQYQRNFDYSIILNDTSKANFYIKILDNYIVINYLNENYVIYKEGDVSYLTIILNIANNNDIIKYSRFKKINLEDYTSPFDMYLNGITKLEKGTYSWKKELNDNLSAFTSALVKPVREILKNKNSIEITRIDTFVTINTSDTKLKLPEGTKIKYKFFKENEDEKQVEFLDAYRMIDSSYYIIPPDENSEYILYIHAEFDDTHKCDYFVKCKI